MRVTRFTVAAAALVSAVATLSISTRAQQPNFQYRVPSLTDETGAPGLALALRKLGSVGTLMQTTAHPDDEPNAMLAYYARHKGMRVALVTATRGDGGQNEIGPELFDALGILRSEELLAAHRFDGAEQYFTRAVDFGFSFSPEETMQKWGKEEIIGDFVRLIRTIRPDVITTLGVGGTGGGQHHQTSAILTLEAYRRAGDPAQFPEQIQQGLKPWQPKKLYQPAGGGFGPPGGGIPGGGRGRGMAGAGSTAPDAPGAGNAPAPAHLASIDANVYEPLLGCTIGEVGSVASGMHMCQGRVPLVGGAGPTVSRYKLIETTVASQKDKDETSLFDGIDTSLPSLASFAGEKAPERLAASLKAIAVAVDNATRALESSGPQAAIPDLATGLRELRALRSGLGSFTLGDAAQYEIDFRLALKEQQFEQAIVLAHALRLDALADDGLIVAGQPVNVSLMVANRGPNDVTVKSVTFDGLEGTPACPASQPTVAKPYACDADLKVPADARITGPYWVRTEFMTRATFAPDAPFGVPFRPTPFRAKVELDVAGTSVTRDLPVQYRYEGSGLVGEKRMEMNVVPAFNVRVAPAIAIVPLKPAPAAASARRRDIRVTVQNQMKGAAAGTVTLKAPAGWQVSPASIPVSFTREDEATSVRFSVTPPVQAAPGEAAVRAEVLARSGPTVTPGAAFHEGYQVIEYPHTQRRHKVVAAEATIKTIDVAVAPGLTLGYVMGVGDQVPPALEQLGVKVNFIDEDELAFGNLSRYNTIVLGVRAYERREDLKAHNARLLKYVEDGGTLIVQYNKTGEFNQAQYGPYPAKVSSNRVTEETAPVQILEKEHKAFTYPNRIRADAWDGWVQERGLYFLGDRDAKYTDLVKLADPYPFNPGEKTGALVEARYGKGRWIYVGLGLWRQLPAGTVGAYQLMANLISLGKAPASPAAGTR